MPCAVVCDHTRGCQKALWGESSVIQVMQVNKKIIVKNPPQTAAVYVNLILIAVIPLLRKKKIDWSPRAKFVLDT